MIEFTHMVVLFVHVWPCCFDLGDERRVLDELLRVGRLPAETLVVAANPVVEQRGKMVNNILTGFSCICSVQAVSHPMPSRGSCQQT